MIKNTIKAVALPLTVTSLMFLQGCNKEEETAPISKTDLLVGDWNLTEVGGNDVTNYDYSYLFKFKSAGDFQWCYENDTDPNSNYCYSGKWTWQDANEDILIIDQLGGNLSGVDIEFEVLILSETALEGNFTSTYDDGGGTDSYTQPVKFLKVN